MKNLILLSLVLFSFNSFSQKITNEWHTDMEKAIKISEKTNKPLMLFFTGSDWCGWCKKLVREVFKTPEFNKWAKNNVVLVDIDFPRRTKLSEELQKQNRTLAQIFQVQGYPTIWIVKLTKSRTGQNVIRYNNSYLHAIGKTGYVAGGPNTWINGVNQIINK